MRFTEYLKELYVREAGREYYLLPINIGTDGRVGKVQEILECLRVFLKKGNLRISWRDKNYQFFRKLGFNKKEETQFLKRFVQDILLNLNPQDFIKESVSEDSIAYVFVVRNFKDLSTDKVLKVYVKFSFVLRSKESGYSIQSSKNMLVDLERSYVDFISVHF